MKSRSLFFFLLETSTNYLHLTGASHIMRFVLQGPKGNKGDQGQQGVDGTIGPPGLPGPPVSIGAHSIYIRHD